MTERIEGRPVVTVPSRAALRDWLAANHAQADAIWLATYKKHHPGHLPWRDAVEELLCWGWIDAVSQKVDDDRSAHLVARRKPGSAWSRVNKDLVESVRASGAMTGHGEAAIAISVENGMWTFLDVLVARQVMGRALLPRHQPDALAVRMVPFQPVSKVRAGADLDLLQMLTGHDGPFVSASSRRGPARAIRRGRGCRAHRGRQPCGSGAGSAG